MGNNPSSSSKPATPVSSSHATPSPAHSYSHSHSHSHSHGHGHDSPKHHPKRDSKHIIPPRTTERVAAPPEASLHQAHGSSISSTSTTTKGPKPLQSIPIAGVHSSSPSSISGQNTANPSTANSLLSTPPTASSKPSSKPSSETRPVLPHDEPTKPVDVPHTEPSSLRSHASAHAQAVEAGLVSQNSISDMSYLTRPPRLPLPIEEEVHTPGSPIIAPSDAAGPAADGSAAAGIEPVSDIEALDSDGMTRKSSGLSNATVEEEEGSELIVDKNSQTVPTLLEWRRGGDKIYVTGTIFQWNRKQRLHPVITMADASILYREGKPGVFAGTVHILPGTHHVRFLVDGIMQTSPDLPTTVDFGNNLVNYIEVSADDIRKKKQEAASKSASGSAQTGDGQAPKTSASQVDESKPLSRGRSVPSASQYFHQIPKYLVDFDQPEDSPAYQYAVTAIEKLPTPPSLPGFLGKPILNAATLLKDDNSVLNMPNHTVLNHLATSSIKDSMLAVSATTRYKNKVSSSSY